MPQKFICQISRVSEYILAICEIKMVNIIAGDPRLIQPMNQVLGNGPWAAAQVPAFYVDLPRHPF
jgi:hypothetical protein